MTHVYAVYSTRYDSQARTFHSKLSALRAATDQIPEFARNKIDVKNTGATHQDGAEYTYPGVDGRPIRIVVERVEVER